MGARLAAPAPCPKLLALRVGAVGFCETPAALRSQRFLFLFFLVRKAVHFHRKTLFFFFFLVGRAVHFSFVRAPQNSDGRQVFPRRLCRFGVPELVRGSTPQLVQVGVCILRVSFQADFMGNHEESHDFGPRETQIIDASVSSLKCKERRLAPAPAALSRNSAPA